MFLKTWKNVTKIKIVKTFYIYALDSCRHRTKAAICLFWRLVIVTCVAPIEIHRSSQMFETWRCGFFAGMFTVSKMSRAQSSKVASASSGGGFVSAQRDERHYCQSHHITAEWHPSSSSSSSSRLITHHHPTCIILRNTWSIKCARSFYFPLQLC